eukprot:3649702-Amphidinium_carterae.1
MRRNEERWLDALSHVGSCLMNFGELVRFVVCWQAVEMFWSKSAIYLAHEMYFGSIRVRCQPRQL